MARGLTVKQRRFAIALSGPANGNQTLAARMAGYRGPDRQLAVQGSVNMKNEAIQRIIKERLDAMVDPSLNTLAEALNATKRRAFLTTDGNIRYTDPEPDFRVRIKTAKQILDHYECSSPNSEANGSEGNEAHAHESGAEPATERPREAKADVEGDDGIDDVVPPDDRILFRQAAKIDAELAELDGKLDDSRGDHGTEE